MIVWCAYCQRLVRENPPFEELVVSHGLCPDCAGREDTFDRTCPPLGRSGSS